MTKKILITIFTFILFFVFATTTNISGAETNITSISINSGKSLNLAVDDFITLDVKTTPSNLSIDGIKFSSSDPNIADVDYKGNVTAKRVGKTTITATLNGKTSTIAVNVSGINKSLGVTFTVKDVPGTNFKEITATPKRYDNDENVDDKTDYLYYIYLPSGYVIEGKSASFVADRNGVYPFTIYDRGNNKRTFYYTVKDIKSTSNVDSTDSDKKNISFDYKLMYDYEKKQVLFNLILDKQRTVVTPNNTIVTNEANYYINTLKNNIPYDFSIKIDDISYNYKIIKQGEFYLLIAMSPVDYDNYSTLVKYFGYNFTTNENYETIPSKDLFYDNGSHEVLVKSDSMSKELFYFNITGIDFRRPSVDISYLEDNTLSLVIKDDFGLDYMITYDGKYVQLKGKSTTYNIKTQIIYNGNYKSIVVDKAGNRTIASMQLTSKKKHRRYDVDSSVHNYKYTNLLFSDIGLKYYDNENDTNLYEMILPAYMKGSSVSYFSPDSPITRAEMITLFCRITDLPYDTGALLKSKFTDINYHWAKDYIAMGSAKKYIAGYKDKTFRPNNYVTRAEFCQMITNIGDFKPKVSSLPATSNNSYADVYGHWAQKQISTVSNRDIVLGNGTYFYPDNLITRGEVVHAINKIYNLNPTNGELNYIDSMYKKYFNFKDIINHKYYNDIIISLVGMYREKIN